MGRDEDRRARFDTGAARWVVQIQTRTTAQDSYGEAVQTWTTVDRRRADIHHLSGTELVEARKVQANATRRGRMRSSKHLSPKARLIGTDPSDGVQYTLEPYDIQLLGRGDVQEFLAGELVV
jgi:SPP1 family predicted phage head-tail adaptor